MTSTSKRNIFKVSYFYTQILDQCMILYPHFIQHGWIADVLKLIVRLNVFAKGATIGIASSFRVTEED